MEESFYSEIMFSKKMAPDHFAEFYEDGIMGLILD